MVFAFEIRVSLSEKDAEDPRILQVDDKLRLIFEEPIWKNHGVLIVRRDHSLQKEIPELECVRVPGTRGGAMKFKRLIFFFALTFRGGQGRGARSEQTANYSRK